MTVRKLNQLIEIAKEYKMYPLVHYYRLKIKYIRLENKYKKLLPKTYDNKKFIY